MLPVRYDFQPDIPCDIALQVTPRSIRHVVIEFLVPLSISVCLRMVNYFAFTASLFAEVCRQLLVQNEVRR